MRSCGHVIDIKGHETINLCVVGVLLKTPVYMFQVVPILECCRRIYFRKSEKLCRGLEI